MQVSQFAGKFVNSPQAIELGERIRTWVEERKEPERLTEAKMTLFLSTLSLKAVA